MPSSKRKFYLRQLIKVKKEEEKRNKNISNKPNSTNMSRPPESMSGKRFKKPG